MKQLLRPLMIIFVLYLGLGTSLLGYDNLYENSSPFYLILFLLLGGLYGVTYFFGTFFTSSVEYT